ncbi:MAG: SRPBCC domain-containing protein [Bacteroidota bacterium]
MEFTLQVSIPASAEAIYQAWLTSEGHTAMTGGEATASDVPNQVFTAWDTYITGRNLILEPNRRIVQSWRTTQFADHEPDSQIEILLAEAGGKTELTLIHTQVPEDGEHYIQGWKDHYFEPMKAYFGR